MDRGRANLEVAAQAKPFEEYQRRRSSGLPRCRVRLCDTHYRVLFLAGEILLASRIPEYQNMIANVTVQVHVTSCKP